MSINGDDFPSIKSVYKVLSQTPFLERVRYDINKRHQRIKMDESLIQHDEELLHQPKVGRPPKNERNKENLPIGDYLFLQNKSKDSHRTQQNQSTIRTSDRSSALLENMRRKRLEEFFSIMDSDHDGYISSNCIELESLPTEVLTILGSVIQKLDIQCISMNMQEWIEHATQKIQQLSIYEKNLLFQKTSQSIKQIKQFKPNINKQSEKIAMSQRQYSGHIGLYQHGLQVQKAKDHRNELIKQEQTKMELQECTFRPQILRSSIPKYLY